MRTTLLICASLFFAVGCSGNGNSTSSAASTEKKTDVYECPMHCVEEGKTEEHTQSTPGTCPVCKMNLTKRAPH